MPSKRRRCASAIRARSARGRDDAEEENHCARAGFFDCWSARPLAERAAFEAQIPTEVLRQDRSRSAVHHEGGAGQAAMPIPRDFDHAMLDFRFRVIPHDAHARAPWFSPRRGTDGMWTSTERPRMGQCVGPPGRRTVNTEPLPGSLVTVTSPPIMRASLREMARPSPVPPKR
jgi:hypothetical protein